MLLYSPRWLFLVPGLLAMIFGVVGMGVLMSGNISIGHIHFGVHTMLYAAMAVLVGYQAVMFSVFTKVFAISEGLLPEDAALNRIFRFVTLESGLIFGCVLMALSTAVTILAFADWSANSFGQLEPEKTLRLVIPAASTFVFGIQTILSSFFLSVLGLRIRRHRDS